MPAGSIQRLTAGAAAFKVSASSSFAASTLPVDNLSVSVIGGGPRTHVHFPLRPSAFGPGSSYRPLPVTGPAREHLLAFARAEEVVTLVPRLVLKLAGNWGDTEVELPDER